LVAVSGADLRYACAHLLRRLATALPEGMRVPEIVEVVPGRALPAGCDFLLEAGVARPDADGLHGVRQVIEPVAPGNNSLEWSWSWDRPVWRGAYLRHGLLVAADRGHAHVMGSVRNLRIPGAQMLEAILPAVSAALSWGVEPRRIREILFAWTGAEHNVQWAGERDGVTVFDDSSCCTADGLARSLEAFDVRVTLVTGGVDFRAGFDLLERIRNRASRVVLLPGTPEWVCTAWGRIVDAALVTDLSAAARVSLERTSPGGIVLYSPGCFPHAGEEGVSQRGLSFVKEFMGA
jgi:UDP-N-acetylmuramoylalanine-D-glutamate ligase